MQRLPRRESMSRVTRTVIVAGVLLVVAMGSADAQVEHRLGGGVHYWRAVGDVARAGFDIDRSGLAPVVSYQLLPRGILYFGLEVEYFPEGFGGATSSAFAPAAYVLVGRGLYAGAGIGVTVSSDFSGNVSDPFFPLRVGWNLELLPRIILDINLNYRADAFASLEGVSTNAITAGAIVRIAF
jgi:hypothetical protein